MPRVNSFHIIPIPLKKGIYGLLISIGVGQKVKYSTFSEYGHVAYQTEGNDACSNMVVNILHTDTPSTMG